MNDSKVCLDDLRRVICETIEKETDLKIKLGRPQGDIRNYRYVCVEFGNAVIPIALILESFENTKHAYVEIEES